MAASVCRQSAYSSSVPAGILVAMHAGEDAVGDRGFEIVGEQERIADDVHPLADAAGVAVAEFGGGKVVFAEELDEGDVAAGIEADEHGIDEAAVGQADTSWPGRWGRRRGSW